MKNSKESIIILRKNTTKYSINPSSKKEETSKKDINKDSMNPNRKKGKK